MSRTIFQNAEVFDGVTSLGIADVVVDGERISDVVARPNAADVTPDDVIYDASGKTVMPGMVAGHGHFSFHNISLHRPLDADMTHPAPYMGVIAAKCAERTLNAGFTTYVGAGAIHNIDVVVRNLIDAGEISGPRIIPCSRDFVPTGNIVDFKPDFWHIADTPLADRLGAVCDGPDEFRREIRRDVKRGAQMIKIYPEGGHGLPDLARLSLDEIRTAVETATLCNARVRCHVFSKPVIKTCIEEGVAIIDHGDHFDDELADLAIEHDVYVLPSLYFAKACVGVYHQQEDIDRWFDYARTSLAAGIEKGVKYVTGDDFGLEQLPHGDNAKELALYVNELGVPAKEALKWATANGAEMSGLPDIGRIAEGKFADLVVVDGDPIQDINVLTEPDKIGLVMKGGAIAKSTLSSHGAGEMQRAAAS